MALFINGVGQDTFSMNGVSIDNLYVDGVLVWSLSTENTPPVISIIGDNPTQLILYGQAYEELGATAIDAEDGDISNDIVIGGDTPNVGAEGYYYVTYNVTDSGGLAAEEQVRTVQVYVVTVPKYELTEALINDGTFDYVPDSNNPNSFFQGKLTESDGTTPYLPTALQYPQNGLLELDNGRILDTQFTIDETSDTYGLYGIYDADGSTVYKIWALDMAGASLGTLYEGDQDTPLTQTGGMALDFDEGTWKITDGRPPYLPSEEVYDPVWINFRNTDIAIDPPDGILHIVDAGYAWINPIIDTQNVASDITVTYSTAGAGAANYTNLNTGNNSACMCDKQITGSAYVTTATAILDIYLPAGTYDIQVSTASERPVGEAVGDYTLGGLGTIQLDGSNSAVDCGGWADVVSAGETIQLSYAKASGSVYAHLAGLNIQRTA